MKDNTIILRSYENLAEANFAKDALEQNGIQSFVSDTAVVQLYPMFTSPLGGYKLHIFERNTDAALEVLKNLEEK